MVGLTEKGRDQMSKSGKRRPWSAAEKMRVVLAGMEPGVEISALCRKEGLNPTHESKCSTLTFSWRAVLLSHLPIRMVCRFRWPSTRTGSTCDHSAD